jgi:hypothetical protein
MDVCDMVHAMFKDEDVSRDTVESLVDSFDAQVRISTHHIPPLRLHILVPEGTITSALTVYSYTLRETDTFLLLSAAA